MMKSMITTLLLFICLCLSVAVGKHATPLSRLQRIRKPLNEIGAFDVKSSLGDPSANPSLPCALCDIIVNEVEGLIAENKTQQEIEKKLEKVCDKLSVAYAFMCKQIVMQLPAFIMSTERRWTVSRLCVEKLHLCEKPAAREKEVVPMKQMTIKLEDAPQDRWTEVCTTYKSELQNFFALIQMLFPDGLAKDIGEIGEWISDKHLPKEYADEIVGCAKAAGVDYGWLTMLNIGYELTDACTSIVAQAADGKMLHARNMDFFLGMWGTNALRSMLVEVHWTKGGVVQFKTSGFAGYAGALSGIKPNVFSVSINTRFYPSGLGDLFYEVIAAFETPNAHMVSFLTRDALTKATSFDEAMKMLATTPLIADVYYTVAGVSAGEGAVISRNRTGARDINRVDATKGKWYVLETNYDHWNPPPWFDNRRAPATNAMNNIGAKNVSLDNMFQVISTRPVLNLQTVYSFTAQPSSGAYQSFDRYCNYPCPE